MRCVSALPTIIDKKERISGLSKLNGLNIG